jgi:ATP-binding cassette subfamily B (MDR/TAP) protein 8
MKVIHADPRRSSLVITSLLGVSELLEEIHDELWSNESLLRKIWTFVREDWLLLIAVAVSGIAGAVVNVMIPMVMGQLVNVISNQLSCSQNPTMSASNSFVSALLASLSPLNAPSGRLLGLFGMKSFLMFAHIALVGLLGDRIARRVRQTVFASILHQEMAFFDTAQSAELASRVGSDVHEFRHTFKQCVSTGIRSCAEVTGSFLQLLRLSPMLTVVLASTMPLLYVVGSLYGVQLRQMSRKCKELEASSLGEVGEVFSNIRTVRAYAAEQREMEKEYIRSGTILNSNVWLTANIGAFQAITSGSIGCMILTVLYYGGALVAQGKMEPGDLMAYLMATQTAQRSLGG